MTIIKKVWRTIFWVTLVILIATSNVAWRDYQAEMPEWKLSAVLAAWAASWYVFSAYKILMEFYHCAKEK